MNFSLDEYVDSALELPVLISALFNNVDKDPTTKEGFYVDLLEEVGEVATCLGVEAGRKPAHKADETTREECVDVVLAALILYRKAGGNLEHFVKYAEKKSKKYSKKVERRCAESLA